MKIAFLTEMGFIGKVPPNHPNMRTEFAWMCALDADHYNIHNIYDVIDYDVVFVIFPKGMVFLNAAGSKDLGFKNYPQPHFEDIDLKDDLQYSKVYTRLVELGVLTPELS